MKTPGRVLVSAYGTNTGIRVKAEAEIENEEDIRCIKIILYGIPEGKLVNLIDARPRSIPAEGLNLKYPEGWRDVGTPLVILKKEDGAYLYFRSLDECVRDKRFVFVRNGNRMDAELIFEEMAVRMTNRIVVPEWEIGYGTCLQEIYEPHRLHVEKSYGLVPWEQRADVPDWARGFSQAL